MDVLEGRVLETWSARGCQPLRLRPRVRPLSVTGALRQPSWLLLRRLSPPLWFAAHMLLRGV